MSALRFERERPASSDSIVIVGSTCTGKTTLARAIRAAAIDGVVLPRRYVTRARRPDDDADESLFVTKAELDALVAAGQTAMRWSRTFEPGHTEHYGFARPPFGALAVYSANNAILAPGNVQPPDVLARALLVGIYASEETRELRFRARSPSLWRDAPAEAAMRLAERADAVFPHVHVVVENQGPFEREATAELVDLVRSVAKQR